jgi:hypothetical protein
VKGLWYKRTHGYSQAGLYIDLQMYVDEEQIVQSVPSQRFSVSFVGPIADEPQPPVPLLPEPSAIPVSLPALKQLSSKQASDHQLRISAKTLADTNRKEVKYIDGSAVPESAWQATIPLIRLDTQGKPVINDFVLDIINQPRAQQLMNQRLIDDEKVDELVRSIEDTPGIVNLPEKIGVLLCPKAYDRLNNIQYTGDVYDGLTPAERAFPADPAKAVISGSRKLVIIAGNHGSVAQVKVIKKAAEEGR